MRDILHYKNVSNNSKIEKINVMTEEDFIKLCPEGYKPDFDERYSKLSVYIDDCTELGDYFYTVLFKGQNIFVAESFVPQGEHSINLYQLRTKPETIEEALDEVFKYYPI